ncbi:MAG: RagB/SusD family nutrient uptake outer membrane protein [Dysgonamonadaceae bacterium]|nr:RagB/SusD family nutrient uptake outer membrane protein [Dysgonamonadaceae bacterium]
MKKIISVLLISLSLAACNYLDIVPDDTPALSDAFKNEKTAESFLYTCYSYQYDYFDFRGTPGLATSNELVCAYHWTSQWFGCVEFNSGVYSSSNPLMNPWGGFTYYNYESPSLYQGIRQCYIFLNHIDEAVPATIDANTYATLKNYWIGEAKFLIAYYHQLLLQCYGPIVFMENETEERYPRLSLDESVDKIAGMYDEAIGLLPASRTQKSEYGRVSKTVAKALKAKLLLYAASPLFNGNQDYKVLEDKEGRQLISQAYDKEKWKRAMTAIDEAITFAKSQGHGLYTFDKPDPFGQDPAVKKYTEGNRQAYLNCRMVLVDDWNKEIIWASTRSENNGNSPQRHAVPKGIDTRSSGSDPVGGLGTTLTIAKIFHTGNGLPPEEDPTLGYTWDAEGRMTVPAGAETCNLHLNREMRFYAAVGFDRGPYEFNSDSTYQLKLKAGEKNGMVSKGNDHLYGGYAVKKIISPYGISTGTQWQMQQYCYPLIRLADLYLQYAEACAEYQGSLDAKAQEYLKSVRERAGLTMNYFEGKSGDALVTAIRRERMIELAFESQWFFDLRRWKMAEEWFKNDKDGMWGLNDEGTNNTTFYKETQLDTQPFVFNKKNYLLPIKLDYINANENLVQNTGY